MSLQDKIATVYNKVSLYEAVIAQTIMQPIAAYVETRPWLKGLTDEESLRSRGLSYFIAMTFVPPVLEFEEKSYDYFKKKIPRLSHDTHKKVYALGVGGSVAFGRLCAAAPDATTSQLAVQTAAITGVTVFAYKPIQKSLSTFREAVGISPRKETYDFNATKKTKQILAASTIAVTFALTAATYHSTPDTIEYDELMYKTEAQKSE